MNPGAYQGAPVYALTYTAGTNGSIAGASMQNVDLRSDGASVEAVPATDYLFVHRSDGSVTDPRRDTGVTSDITVEAVFSQISMLSDCFEP